jgi:tRNA A-37 threonylcarbamoyl transferase component Bud32
VPPTEIPLNPTVLTPDGVVVTRAYQLIEEIGRGAHGTVWRARATATGREYAVKILRDLGTDAPKATARFLQERGILLRLRHENLVAVHDLLTTADGRLALVLDLVSGGTLRELLRQRGSLPAAEAAELLAQVADGLAAAHGKAVVHRDLKPDNILLAPRMDGGVRLRLTDFGIARVLDGPRMTTSGAVLGTPNYMAPEVIEGSPATPAADVYGLGIMLYELLAGRPPFDGDGVDTAILVRHTRATALPLAGMAPRVWALIEACLDRDPAQRPDAKTLRATLRTLAAETVGVEAIRPVRRGDRRPTFLLTDTGAAAAGRAGPPPRPKAAARISREKKPEVAAEPEIAAEPETPAPETANDPGDQANRTNQTPVPEQRRPRRRRAISALAAMIAVALALSGYLGMRYATNGGPVDEGAGAAGAEATAGPGGGTAAPTSGPGVGGKRAVAAAGPSVGSALPIPEGTHGGDPVASASSAPGGVPEELGEWKCSERRWAVGHPATGTACHALGTNIRVKGSLSAVSGTEADLQIVVETDSGKPAAGPYSCENKKFTDATSRHDCGPETLDLAPGRYRVVTKWTYHDSVVPEGSVVGDVFTW